MMILQLGTTVVTSAAVSSVPTTVTVTKSKTAFPAGQSMNFHEPHPGTNQISQQAQSQIIHRPADHSAKTTVRYKPEPSCIVEVHTPKLPSQKVEEVSSEDVVPKEEIIDTRPSSSGEVIAQFVLQDHNYVAALPASPPLSPTHTKASSVVNGLGLGNNSLTQGSAPYAFGSGLLALRNAPRNNDDDDTNSVISSNPGREVEPEGEETETAPEGEGEEDAVTRCICDFEHDDGYMVICDKCMVWQHVQCMFVDQANFPKESEEYLCERCQPRRVDRVRARLLQLRKREELHNDSSSDATSTDTDSGIGKLPQVGIAARKRRRKSETVNPVKKNSSISSNNSNNGSSHSNTNSNNSSNSSNNPVTSNAPQAKPVRQRRDSVTSVMQRRSSAQSRKKEAQSSRQTDTKRVPVRRKSKNRVSDDDNKEANVVNPVQQLRQWIDNYEEAVTNHYSPELRARISNIRVNGVHSDLKVSALHGNNSGSKCRVMQSSPGVRILVANVMLSTNVPVIELRGKYMLSSQQKSSPLPFPSTKRSRPPPGPFLFFYRLPKDGPEVCVDTRTYGNDARFIRRSCKPNAEVRHCIEKGILHLYIVTTSSVEKNNEITISHDGYLDPVGQRFVCACGNPKECCGSTRRNGLHESSERERRRRGRRAHSSEDDTTSQQVNTSPTSHLTSSPSSSLPSSTMLRRNSNSNRSPVKTPSTPPPSTDDSCEKAVECSPVKVEKAEKKKKLTREERKMEAIMKAFERLEKDEQKQKEHMAKQQAMRSGKDSVMEVKKEPPPIDEAEESKPVPPVAARCLSERPKRRRRKGRGRLNSTTQPAQQTLRQHRRRTRQNSGDSDASSADEILKAEPGDPPSSPDAAVVSSNDVNSQDSTTGSKMQTAADLLLALSNTQIPDEEQSFQPSPDAELPSPVAVNTPQGHSGGVNANLFNSTVCDSGGSSSQSSTPPTPLSSACLLVAAAVGPLAPGFKFPKTKKVLMNEWLNKSPDLPSNSTPSTILPPSSGSTEGLEGFASYDKSLATLVQAATRVGMNGSSSAQRSGSDPGVGSAKKRWLRQAISEECDSPTAVCTSPNSRPESPPYVAPLKKRRLARESMSSEQSFTPPTTPTEHLMSHGSPQSQKCGSHCSVANNIAAACEDGEPVGSPEGLGSPNTQEDEDEEDEEEEDYEDGDEQNSNVLRDSVEDETYRDNHPVNSNDNVCLEDFKKVEGKECVEEEGKALNSSQSILHPPEAEEDEDEEDVEEEELEEEEDEEGEEEKMQVRQFNSNKLEKEDQSSNPASAQPTKRKLSISEYRQRKQRNNSCSEQLPRIEENENSSPAPCGRSRSDSTSSSTSSESSDDARTNKILETPPSLSTLPLFLHSDGSEDKKAGEEMNYMRWNSAPTLVERQRENLTERLRREFGLFLSDDEEQERVRKQGLASEGSKDGKKKAPPPPPPPPSVPPPDAGTRIPMINMYSHPYGTANAGGSYGPVYVPGTGARPQNSSSSSYIYSCPLKGGAPVYSAYPVTGGSKGLGNSPKPYLLPSPYPQGHPQQVVMVGPPRTGTYGSQPSSSAAAAAAAPQQNSVNNASFYTVAAAKYYQSAPRS
ncbi:inactive histone-lysine N-methyltransferase 2E isoform X2 [Anabrus simplex]|uniref:inactive histone-lysine N-methyltransferase 2E isoform X2 n=1 Tax=Anabrus simplex TaxID=316456 RepID=UPI0035A2A5F6